MTRKKGRAKKSAKTTINKAIKYWGSSLTTGELRETLERRAKELERSMNAIGNQSDFALKKLPAYNLFKELSSGEDGNRRFNMPSGSRLATIQALNKIDAIQQMKSSTLKGAKEIVVGRRNRFVSQNVDALTVNYMKQNPELTKTEAHNKAVYYLRKLTKSEEFYDFLHSDVYEKMTQKYNLESGDLIRDFMTRTFNLVEHYKEMAEKENEVQETYENYIEGIETTKGAKFKYKKAIAKDTITDDELERVKKRMKWK